MPVHTAMPKHRGEHELALQLRSLDDGCLHQFYSLNHIPGVPDIDLFLWDERTGVFCIEIKAVPLRAVLEFSLSHCHIEGRERGHSPQRQAYEASEKLRQFLHPKRVTAPFMVASACFPRVSRYDWNQCWAGGIAGEFSERMLFAEDFQGGIAALRDRLAYIYRNPPIRSGAREAFRHVPTALSAFCAAIEERGARRAAPSELEKLRELERRHAQDAERDVPAKSGTRLLYTGQPGTGKTFRLLRIAVIHALSGSDVVMFCYNKTLAADINRLLSFSDLLGTRRPRVYDVFEFVRLFANSIGFEEEMLDEHAKDYDAWASMLVDEMRVRSSELPKYDTILVDEAQDLKEWAFVMCDLHAADGASLVVAAGSGQELYGANSKWLTDFSAQHATKNLRRNFRNTRPVFQLAQCAFETGLETSKVAAVLAKMNKKSSKGDPPRLEFERSDGRPPAVLYVDDSVIPHEDQISEDIARADKIEAEFARIVRNVVENLEDQQRLIDVLILVPSDRRAEYDQVRRALADAGVPYVDYVFGPNRRDIADVDSLRLCTFHSSRGLEGQIVVVMGFEGMRRFCQSVNTAVHKLSYIVLSRATIDLFVVSRPSMRDNDIDFIEATLAAMRTPPKP